MDKNYAIDTMNAVKTSVLNILDKLNEGERAITKDIIDKVVAETKVQISIINGLVPMIIKEWVGEGKGEVSAGRGGGIFRGGKKTRVDPRARCTTCNQVIRQKTSKEENVVLNEQEECDHIDG